MLSAEEFIKQHSKSQKQKSVQDWWNAEKYDLKFYRSKNDIARDLDISRQTVAKRIGDLGFHEVEVKTKSGDGVRYYVKDEDIIKFAFYLLQK